MKATSRDCNSRLKRIPSVAEAHLTRGIQSTTMLEMKVSNRLQQLVYRWINLQTIVKKVAYFLNQQDKEKLQALLKLSTTWGSCPIFTLVEGHRKIERI